MTAKSVVVIREPSGLFAEGAEFTTLDLAFGVVNESWPPGVVFNISGANGERRQARFIGRVLMRDDGTYLKAHRSGAYWWKSRDD